jgi:hypothetical protein
MAKPDALTAITTIDGYREVWEGLIPEENFDWFLARIKTAVGLYYDLPDQAEFSGQLKKIESATTDPSSELVQLVSNASEPVRKLLELNGGELEIPSPGSDGLADFATEIRSRIIVASYWRPERDKRRRITKLTATLPFKRPRNARLEMLVSFVSAAYAGATGTLVKRSWADDNRQGIEIVLDDIFVAVGIGDARSYLEALRRQVKNRN